jgi:hypothetical protein
MAMSKKVRNRAISAGHSADRTSAAQLLLLSRIATTPLKVVARHVADWRVPYSFLSGITFTLLSISAFVWYGLFAFPLPWKVTDPTDPRFDPGKFRFTDYSDGTKLDAALETMFPVGTSKEIVDAALSKAGARVTAHKPANNEPIRGNLFYYSYWNLRATVIDQMLLTPAHDNAWEAAIYYDQDNRVKRIVGINP